MADGGFLREGANGDRIEPPPWVRTVRHGLVALLLTACASPPLDLGPAMIGVYLGTETDQEALLPYRLDSWHVVQLDLRFGIPVRDLVVEGVPATLLTPDGQRHPLREVGGGLWTAARVGTPELHVPVGQWATLDSEPRAQPVRMAALVPPILRTEHERIVSDGQPASLLLPPRWRDSYDYVLWALIDDAGVHTGNVPATAQEWLSFVSRPTDEGTIELPASALEPGTGGALAVYFLRQMDPEVVFDGPINEPVSMFLVGTAWLIPVVPE